MSSLPVRPSVAQEVATELLAAVCAGVTVHGSPPAMWPDWYDEQVALLEDHGHVRVNTGADQCAIVERLRELLPLAVQGARERDAAIEARMAGALRAMTAPDPRPARERYNAESSTADLRLAVRRGYMLLPVRGSGGVTVKRGVLRYDPGLPDEDRAPLVLRATRPRVLSQR